MSSNEIKNEIITFLCVILILWGIECINTPIGLFLFLKKYGLWIIGGYLFGMLLNRMTK